MPRIVNDGVAAKKHALEHERPSVLTCKYNSFENAGIVCSGTGGPAVAKRDHGAASRSSLIGGCLLASNPMLSTCAFVSFGTITHGQSVPQLLIQQH